MTTYAPGAGDEVFGRGSQLLAGDALAPEAGSAFGGVSRFEPFEPFRDDGLGVDEDRVRVALESHLAETFEDRLDGALRQWERGDRDVLPAAHLLGDREIDTLLVEDSDHGVATADRDHDLCQSHTRRSVGAEI
jgi:hypothetical protein